MRLRSLELVDELFAGGRVELEFGGVTALWGPNDAGKTTLLVRVHDALAWVTGRAPELLPDALAIGAVVLELSPSEADRIAAVAVEDFAVSDRPLWIFNGTAQIALSTPDAAHRAVREDRTTGRLYEPWIRLCASLPNIDAVARARLTEALLKHRALLLRATGAEEPSWRAYWAVPRALLEELEIQAPDSEAWVGVIQATDRPVVGAALPTPIAAPGEWTRLATWFVTSAVRLGRPLLMIQRSQNLRRMRSLHLPGGY